MSSEKYRINNQSATCFLTFTVTDWVDVFTRRSYKNIIVDLDALIKIEMV